MKVFTLLLFILAGCATRTVETDRLSKSHDGLPTKSKLSVPFIKQDKYLCGPASVAMVLNYYGKNVKVDDLTYMYTKKAKGTFQTDMIGAVRSYGLLPIPVKRMEDMLKEVSAGNPVIVFQNQLLTFMPKNHYAVVTGYNLKGPDIILHSGDEKFDKADMRFFERSFILGGKWALLALPPSKEPVTTTELTYLNAAASLEETGKITEAEMAYSTALKKWPDSLPAELGLANIQYGKKEFSSSLKFLRTATNKHPESPLAWHNRAYAEAALGMKKAAQISSQKAIQLADETLKPQLTTSLKEWL